MRSNERGCCGVGFHGPAANWGAQSTWPSSSGRTISAAMNNTRFDSGGFLVCLVTSRIGRDIADFSYFFSLSQLLVSVSMTYIYIICIYIYIFIYFCSRTNFGDDAIVSGGSTTWCRVNILNIIQ